MILKATIFPKISSVAFYEKAEERVAVISLNPGIGYDDVMQILSSFEINGMAARRIMLYRWDVNDHFHNDYFSSLRRLIDSHGLECMSDVIAEFYDEYGRFCFSVTFYDVCPNPEIRNVCQLEYHEPYPVK